MKYQFVRKLVSINKFRISNKFFLPRLKNTRYFLGKCRFKKKCQNIYFTNQNEFSLFVCFVCIGLKTKKIGKTCVALNIEQNIKDTLDSGINVGPTFINFGFFQALLPY